MVGISVSLYRDIRSPLSVGFGLLYLTSHLLQLWQPGSDGNIQQAVAGQLIGVTRFRMFFFSKEFCPHETLGTGESSGFLLISKGYIDTDEK